MTDITWHQSSRCAQAECVEVAYVGDEVWVRSSEEPTILAFTTAEWDAFVAGAKDGEFDV